MSRFREAVRTQSRLRAALDGPPGAGKSFTALTFAFALAKLLYPDHHWPVAVIDTERGSASKYAGEQPDPDWPAWTFRVVNLATFAPTEYTAAINDAGREGFPILVIDSLSHAWAGKDGALELKDKSGDSNSFTAWKTITPMHNAMVDAILQSPCHVIVTMRSKVEHVLEANDQGKMVPRKIGMAPIQRQGMEYEFDIYGSLDWSHVLTVSKSRCRAVADAVVVKPGAEFIRPVAEWLSTGQAAPETASILVPRLSDEQLQALVRLAHAAGQSRDVLGRTLAKRYGVGELIDLNAGQAEDFRLWLEGQASRSARQQPAPAATFPTKPASNPEEVRQALQQLQEKSSEQPVPGNGNGPQVKPGKATAEQLASLRRLRDILQREQGLTAEQWKKILENRSVTTAVNLTPEQADELIVRLRSRVQTKQLEEALYPETQAKKGDESAADDSKRITDEDGPAGVTGESTVTGTSST